MPFLFCFFFLVMLGYIHIRQWIWEYVFGFLWLKHGSAELFTEESIHISNCVPFVFICAIVSLLFSSSSGKCVFTPQ